MSVIAVTSSIVVIHIIWMDGPQTRGPVLISTTSGSTSIIQVDDLAMSGSQVVITRPLTIRAIKRRRDQMVGIEGSHTPSMPENNTFLAQAGDCLNRCGY
jgi:hypothetical protein